MTEPIAAAPGLPTLPASISMSMRGFRSHEEGQSLAGALIDCLQEISRVIDLSTLDGVTLAYDYPEALDHIDRGYDKFPPARPSDAETTGIGMVLPVLRDGKLKSHIVLRPDAIAGLLPSAPRADFHSALYSVAHECGHVEAMACFERAFPKVSLGKRHDHPHDAQRWDVMLTCWTEFAACWISAQFAGDLAAQMEDVFLLHLDTSQEAINQGIQGFRRHKDRQRVLAEIYAIYGALMKYAAYHLGNILGQGKSVLDFPKTIAALEDHWFRESFRDMDLTLRQIASELGRWPDMSKFDQIADIADSIIETNVLDQIQAINAWNLGGRLN